MQQQNTGSLIESVIRNVKNAAVDVYNEAGAGLGDHLYDACLRKELSYQQVSFVRIYSMPFFYKGERIDDIGGSIFLLVENCLLVEINGFADLRRYNEDLMRTQLRQVSQSTALIINFNVDDSSKLFKRVSIKDSP